ncbi:MAG TPA: hypothetical protein VHE33_14040 [Acidobacteriaceae bacterium]|nr:hypothetical protein [Acidobacteriaceae bacterium]
MKFAGRFVHLAVFATCFALTPLLAQSNTPAQNPQSAQDQSQPVTGVSHPPADDTIMADEDLPTPVPRPKPSAAIPITPVQPAATTAPALQHRNYEDDIVTSAPASTSSASLSKHAWNPDEDIVSVVASNPNELASGTNVRVRLSTDLSTAETLRGQSFKAIVDRDVYKDGRIIIPVGAEMRGRVVQVSQGHHIGPKATLRLRPESILLPDGTIYHIYAEAVHSSAPGTRTDNEGGIQAAPHYKKDAVEYGAGAGAGAAAGALIAGPVGAGVGSLVGAGAVTAHMIVGQPEAAKLPPGSVLTFSLTEPMELTPMRATAN